PDPEAAINAVVAAVRSGRITPKRLNESVMRLLQAKARLGLASKRLVDLNRIHEVVSAPESVSLAQQISDKSVTLVKNDGALVPLRTPASTAFVILAESRTGVEGQAFALELRRRAANAIVIQVDQTMSDADLDAAVQHASQASQYVIAAFASVAAYRGNVALGGGLPQLVQKLVATRKPVAFVSLGNPYLLRAFPDVNAYLTTYSSVPDSEVSVVKALFGEIPIAGKLPVTIPGLAKYGDGIEVDRQASGPATVGSLSPDQLTKPSVSTPAHR
ncbi:MAG TPA: glycoside hydrolase family 3 C-terminal domain-containing protein, partial [Bryobacteraceae bacterium]|nr:glycoside hydrolase family 3 C-terminal domain-containing protein [Bryobacteraceae bacterium]